MRTIRQRYAAIDCGQVCRGEREADTIESAVTSIMAPESSAALKDVTPLGSSTTPVIVGSEVMPSELEMPVSWAIAAVMAGSLVSLAVVVMTWLYWLELPAASLATTVNDWLPDARATLVNVKFPRLSACVFWIGVFKSNAR